jgi:hypothetical protein
VLVAHQKDGGPVEAFSAEKGMGAPPRMAASARDRLCSAYLPMSNRERGRAYVYLNRLAWLRYSMHHPGNAGLDRHGRQSTQAGCTLAR